MCPQQGIEINFNSIFRMALGSRAGSRGVQPVPQHRAPNVQGRQFLIINLKIHVRYMAADWNRIERKANGKLTENTGTDVSARET
jgi:hypothetical protein